MASTYKAKKLLSRIAREAAVRHRDKLQELKGGASELKRPDWIWHSLLVSFSTMGNSRGYEGLIKCKGNYKRVTYRALSRCSAGEQRRVLTDTLSAAKVRMPRIKANWLLRNHKIIAKAGGLSTIKRALLAEIGTTAKIKFLRQFKGIGPKYARNMLMDVYHPDFRESIAIDERIKSLSEKLNLSFKNYEDHERFYLEVARAAGLQGWELDRLIYQYQQEFLCALTASFWKFQ